MSQLVPRLGAGVGEKLAIRVQALYCRLWAPSWVHAGNQLPESHQCGDDLSPGEGHLLNCVIWISLELRTELRAFQGTE